MTSRRVVRRLAVLAGGSAAACMGVLALSAPDPAHAGTTPAPLAPTTSTAPSVAPANPVDCTDPNNAVNCTAPPLDSPLVDGGTAAPGSPFRD